MDTDTIMAQHVPTHPGLGNQAETPGTNWEKAKGRTTAAAAQVKRAWHQHLPFPWHSQKPSPSDTYLPSGFQCEAMQVLGFLCASKT